MQAPPQADTVDYDKGWTEWGDMIKFSPAPFHRRRLIVALAREVAAAGAPASVLDVGCGNGEVLRALAQAFPGARLCGADLSEHVIEENRRRFPHARFAALDLGAAALPETFDLVVCSEVVEHVRDWEAALANLRAMCAAGRHLVVTVPAGKVFPIDRMMGHVRHFTPDELVAGLARAGFASERVWRWGFPFHTLYKTLINVSPEATMGGFGQARYGWKEKAVAGALTAAFYLNLRQSRFGRQLVVRARAV
jgi:SAM-dependent methyltransferase